MNTCPKCGKPALCRCRHKRKVPILSTNKLGMCSRCFRGYQRQRCIDRIVKIANWIAVTGSTQKEASVRFKTSPKVIEYFIRLGLKWARHGIPPLLLVLICIAATPPIPKLTKHAVPLRSPKGAEVFPKSGHIAVPPKLVNFSMQWDYDFADTNVNLFRCYYWTNHGVTNLFVFAGKVTNGTLTGLAPKVDWYAAVTAVETTTNGPVESDWSRIVCNHPTNMILHFDYVGTNLQTKTSLKGNWVTQNKTSLSFTNVKSGNLFIRGMGKTNVVTHWKERF